MPLDRLSPTRTVQIVMVVFPGFLLQDAAGPLQVFSMADQEAQKSGQGPRYRLRTVSSKGGLISSACGLAVQTDKLPRPASIQGGTLLVAGGDGTASAMQDKRLLRWLQASASQVARCGSICTGAFVLAQAGLLDGRCAVTHWQDAPLFQRLFPQVSMQDDAIYVRDGHIYTSAGVTTGIDLSLALVEADHTRALSLRVAKRMVVPFRRAGGQRQFSSELLAQCEDDQALPSRLTRWLKPRIRQDIHVADMAHAMNLSARTLHRQLVTQTGQSPARLLSQLRLEQACILLEKGPTPLKRIVQHTGFGNEYNLRRCFKQQLGVTPGDYQQRFCATRTRA